MSKNGDRDRGGGINIVTINLRGLWGNEIHIAKLAEGAEIVVIPEA